MSIYIKNVCLYYRLNVYNSRRGVDYRPMCWSAGRNTVESNVQRLGSSNRVRELANKADF